MCLFQQIIASNEQGREADSSRAEVTLSSDVIMHVLRLHRRQSELHRENEPAAGDFASDDDEAFYIGFGNGNAERDQGENSDPRECIVT
jgi:WD repeat-containing protein 42A